MFHQNEFSHVAVPKPLDFLWLELTNRCNLKCVHCYAGSGPEEGGDDTMTLADYKRLLGEASVLGCKAVQFIGGEPSLNKDLPALILEAKALGYEQIEVFTNLIALPRPLLQNFIDNQVDIATSFYSSDAAIHDEITARKGSQHRTLANIDLIVQAGLNLRVGIVEMDLNRGHWDATTALLAQHGVTNIGGDSLREVGRGDVAQKSDMSELCGQCATNVLAVGPDGKIAPCIMSKAWSVANAHEASLLDIVPGAHLQGLREEIALATKRPEACVPEICKPVESVTEVALCDDEGKELATTAWCNPDRDHNCVPEKGDCMPCNPKNSGGCGPRSCQPRPY